MSRKHFSDESGSVPCRIKKGKIDTENRLAYIASGRKQFVVNNQRMTVITMELPT
jgi:hypothetical protein